MAQFFQTFDDGTLGQPYPGFTTKISRSGDSVNIKNDAVLGRKFLQLFKGGTGGSLAVAWDVLNGAQDVEQLVLFKMNGAIPTTGRYGILLNRYDGTTEATTRGFAATFTPASSVPSIIINEDSVGTVHYTNYAWENNQLYWARFRVNGNDESFKIWKYGDDEPTAWTLSGTFAGSTIASPYSGVGNFQAWSNMLVYQLSAGTNGDKAPKTDPSIPSSTPQGVFGAGFGAPMGWAGMFGGGTIPAFTVESLDYNANAFIEWQKTLSYQANALIVHQKSLDYAANAFIDKQYSADYTANAFILWQLGLSYQANASIERIESVSYTANAEIESYYFTADVSYTANARIERVESADYAANAFIDHQHTLDYVANAFIDWQNNVGYNANAFLEKQHQLDYTANALIDYRYAVDYDANAFIEWQLSQTYAANAFIEHVRSIGHAANARIERQGEYVDYEANARIERIEGLSYATNANISNPIPDKLPQTWETEDTHEAADWTADDKEPTAWKQADERQPTTWEKGEESQPQQWSDSDNKKPADWSPIYYD